MAARLVPGLRVSAVLIFGCRVGVGAQISGFQRGFGLHTGIITGFNLGDSAEHMIQTQTVTDLMDHGVSVTEGAVERWVQNDATCERNGERVRSVPLDGSIN